MSQNGISQGEKETQRVEAFSDGVFAIAITLLILELNVPKPDELGSMSLWQSLLLDWHSYIAFVMSFVSILIMWFNHHKLFGFIQRVDSPLMFLNGFLLLTVTIVPWPTAVLAEFWDNPYEEQAAVIFCGLMVLLGIAFNALWRYATYKGRLLPPETDMEQVKRITMQYNFGPLGYGVSFIIAFWDADLAVYIAMALAAFFAFTGAVDVRTLGRKRRAA